MIITSKARYAVMAAIEIANNQAIQPQQPVNLNSIAKSQEISLLFLEQIFRKLKKAGIVEASKGRGGGYLLAKLPNKISIASIIAAVEEPIKMTRCISKNKGCMNNKTRCKTHHLWHGLEKNIFGYLNSVSLADL